MKQMIHDVTCRDGNHALSHKISTSQVAEYARSAFEAGVMSMEVGHGNGLGGSSSLVGHSRHHDYELIEAAKSSAPEIVVGVHSMPSFAILKRDLLPAISCGATYFRLGAHSTEMDTIEQHAKELLDRGLVVAAAPMMISHISFEALLEQMNKIEKFGITEVVLMDSVGRLTPSDVDKIINGIKSRFNFRLGFHAHDNFGLAVSNSLSAIKAGADFVDASILGMGAGAGNAPLELLAIALEMDGKHCEVTAEKALDLASKAEGIDFFRPTKSLITAITAFSNLFSGFSSVILQASKSTGSSPVEIAKVALGKKLVAGQENVIFEIAEKIKDCP